MPQMWFEHLSKRDARSLCSWWSSHDHRHYYEARFKSDWVHKRAKWELVRWPN